MRISATEVTHRVGALSETTRVEYTGRPWLLIAALALVFTASLTSALSRENYQRPGRPLVCDPTEMDGEWLKACRAWIGAVKRPDTSGTCCGEADAFIADTFRSEDGKFYAIITRDYPTADVEDGEGGSTESIPYMKGHEILIPDNKINHAFDNGGNPSGHGIVFLGSSGEVMCYFTPSLG